MPVLRSTSDGFALSPRVSLAVGAAAMLLILALGIDTARLERTRVLKATLHRAVPTAIAFDDAVDLLARHEYALLHSDADATAKARTVAAASTIPAARPASTAALAASLLAVDSVLRALGRLEPLLDSGSRAAIVPLRLALGTNARALQALRDGWSAAPSDATRLQMATLEASRESIRSASSDLTSRQRARQAERSFEQVRVSETLAFTSSAGSLLSLVLVVVAASLSAADMRARRSAEARLRIVLHAMHEGVTLQDTAGVVLMSNPAAEQLLGRGVPDRRASMGTLEGTSVGTSEGTSVGTDVGAALPRDTTSGAAATNNRSRETTVVEERVEIADGAARWVETSITPLFDTAGGVTGVLRVSRDITERRAMQDRLGQAERLQAVGTLAGGIAHDFNNLIAVVHGTAELMRDAVPPAQQADVDAILVATTRARRLTQQMLTFARRRQVQLGEHDLDEAVAASLPLVTHLLAVPAHLDVRLAAPSAMVRIDPDELGTAIINLVTNARDAMPAGGVVFLSTDTVRIGGRRASDRLAAGAYARVVVRDGGHGMSPEVMSRAFEPFFTTKDVGAGTGLGLATVHGVLKDFGGTVTIDSVPTKGTTVTLWLPLLDAPVRSRPALPDVAPPVASTGRRILIVDDDAQVRGVVARLARLAGHRAVLAESAASAMEFLEAAREPVDLVISDYAMPDVTGRELLDSVRDRWPALPLALMSGYTADGATQEWMEAHRISYLPKPFTRAELDTLVDTMA